ncbi:cell wall hydrolase [Alkalicoccus urumqiensis]|nr:stalk domain-containing protein [Alkalicoccus urumqiensis]
MLKKLLMTTAAAAGLFAFAGSAQASDAPDVKVNGQTLNMDEPVKIEQGRTLVPVRLITEELGAQVEWNQDTQQVRVHTPTGDTLTMKIDEPEIALNGKSYGLDAVPHVDNGRTYLPLRHVGELSHSRVGYADRTVTVDAISPYTIKPGDTVASIASSLGISADHLRERNQLNSDALYAGETLARVIPTAMKSNLSYEPEVQTAQAEEAVDPQDLDLLARLIQQEAGGEPYKGQVAVGSVVLNRVSDSRFPSTVRGVIYQRSQFTPAMTGKINRPASQSAIQAARDALLGESPAGNALYFHNPRVTRTALFMNKRATAVIGNHRFVR